ncbi:hypothetical protein ACVILH_003776 [Bradyrhizobium sp. USDA 4353]
MRTAAARAASKPDSYAREEKKASNESGALPTAFGRTAAVDRELLDPASRLDRSDQPARLLAAAGPGLGRLRIAVFRQDPRIFATRFAIAVVGRSALAIRPFDYTAAAIQDRQTTFELALFRCDPFSEDLADLLMERPEVIERHRLEIDLLGGHAATFICDLYPAGLMSYNSVFRSASGSLSEKLNI